MQTKDSIKNKLLILLFSCITTGISIFLYFLDASMPWNDSKIIFCVIVNVWVFFMIPALRRGYLVHKEEPMEKWVQMGVHFGVSGICVSALVAPFFGIVYYFDIYLE